MYRKLILAAALGALASPALAATQVIVNVAGLDDRAAHAVIVRAAQTACRAELAGSTDLVKFYVRPDCVSVAVADAEARLAAMRGLATQERGLDHRGTDLASARSIAP